MLRPFGVTLLSVMAGVRTDIGGTQKTGTLSFATNENGAPTRPTGNAAAVFASMSRRASSGIAARIGRFYCDAEYDLTPLRASGRRRKARTSLSRGWKATT